MSVGALTAVLTITAQSANLSREALKLPKIIAIIISKRVSA